MCKFISGDDVMGCRDSEGRLCSHVVAIDALPLMNSSQKKQCEETNLLRELNKVKCWVMFLRADFVRLNSKYETSSKKHAL